MANEFLTIEGIVVPPSALSLRRSRDLAELVASGKLAFTKFVEARSLSRNDGGPPEEIVVLDVSIERPQAPANDIRHTERLAIVFQAADRLPPEVLSLRPDFPWVPHINLRQEEFPRSLCLYDRPWSEVSPRWTPAGFVERIRFWLAATARGELHQQDQPLEPLLLHNGTRIILPADISDCLESEAPVQLDFFLANPSSKCRTLIAVRLEAHPGQSGLKVVATTFLAARQTHGLIRRSPRNLNEVHSFLTYGGIDLIADLRRRLVEWLNGTSPARRQATLDARLALIVALPLSRTDDDSVQQWDFWTFATMQSIREVGKDIGAWDIHGKEVGLLVAPDDSHRGVSIDIEILSPYLAFSRQSAASANGASPDSPRIVAIGAGALGSQIITTLTRSGFGDWTIVDEDNLLPHNLARHALSGEYVGSAKATGLAHYLNGIYDCQAKAIVADVLAPGEEAELQQAFADAGVILDLSASASVSRRLITGVDSSARRISAFLNPQGTDLVVLAEDCDRKIRLDALESQYYRAVVNDPALNGHFNANRGRLRYGRSCRDISTIMSTQLVTMHAGAACELIRRSLASDEASIQILRYDPQSLGVVPVSVAPTEPFTQQIREWTVVVDSQLVSKLTALRGSKLPNETGGVFLGSYDLDAKVVHIVDTIPSPPDSAEWPTLYIRGSEGLLARIEDIADRCAGQLEYVGEWHSHPDGCSTAPSMDDLLVFGWLTEHMAVASRPALMAIVGEGGCRVFLGEMVPSGGWPVGSEP